MATTAAAKEEACKNAIPEQFTPEKLKRLNSGVSNGRYHYLSVATIMSPIGKAFAEDLVK